MTVTNKRFCIRGQVPEDTRFTFYSPALDPSLNVEKNFPGYFPPMPF